MAELETTTLAGSGVPAGTVVIFYKDASGRLVAPGGLTLVSGIADARAFTPAESGAGVMGLGVQRVAEATDSQLSAGIGATGDAAVAVNAAGSVNAKLRLMAAQLDAIQASLAVLDNGIAGNEFQVDIVSGGLTITRPATWTITGPSMATAESLLIASNTNRLGLFVRNRSDVALYLVGGVTAATLLNTPIVIDPGATWHDTSGYTGPYRGILDASGTTANCPVGELTA